MTLHKKKILFIASFVITLVVFASIFIFLSNIQVIKPQIETAASISLGMDVRIKGRIGVALLPSFGLLIKNVNVQNRGLDVVTIKRMKIGLKIFPLAKKEFQISRIGFAEPVFSFVRYKNGMYNFTKQERTLPEKPFAVKKISISEGNLVYADEMSGKKIEVNNFNLILRNLSYKESDSAEPAKSFSFKGKARCKKLKIHNFTMNNLAINATVEKGIFNLNPIRMDIFGKTGNGSIHADVTGPSPHYRVIYTLTYFRIEDLLKQYSLNKTPQKTIEGPVNFSAELTATGNSADEIKRSLNGNLSLNGEDLQLYSMDIDALIMKYERSQNFNLIDMGAFLLAGPFGPILTKSYNFTSLYEESRGGKGIIRKLVSVWKVKNGIAETRDVAIASNKQRIAMKGKLNFISERFVDVTVAVLDKQGCAVYSEKVRGPFRKPKIQKINFLTSLSGPLVNPLKDAWEFIQGKECTVFYSGSVVHP